MRLQGRTYSYYSRVGFTAHLHSYEVYKYSQLTFFALVRVQVEQQCIPWSNPGWDAPHTVSSVLLYMCESTAARITYKRQNHTAIPTQTSSFSPRSISVNYSVRRQFYTVQVAAAAQMNGSRAGIFLPVLVRRN